MQNSAKATVSCWLSATVVRYWFYQTELNKMDALFDEDAAEVDYQMDTDILEDEEITQEDAWVVIDKYFLERGQLIRADEGI